MGDATEGDRPRPATALPSALDHTDDLLTGAGERGAAVFLDYDGTLTPIVDRPDLAVLSEDMRRAVERLASVTLVALVSGRDLDDLRRMAAIEGVAYAGSHGFQLLDRDGREEVMEQAVPYREDLRQAANDLERTLAAIPGALLERKGFGLAVHYRQVAPERESEVREQVEALARREPRLRLTGGKKVIELRPALDWDKGRAVLALLERWGEDAGGSFPIYIGDDETDEDAFRALRDRGAGVIVGDAPATLAHYRLGDVDEVRYWLDALAGRLAERR